MKKFVELLQTKANERGSNLFSLDELKQLASKAGFFKNKNLKDFVDQINRQVIFGRKHLN